MNSFSAVSATKAETKRELAKAKTRRALLKSALQIYSLEGACRMSMNKIAKGANIAQPSFYNHFDSLETLQNELSRQLKNNYLSPMRMAWVNMLKDYAALSKEAFHQRCEECLTLIFDAAFQNIALFQRLIEDSLRVNSQTEPNGLVSLMTEIREEWTKIFIQGLEASDNNFSRSEVNLCVDMASAQVHELILGCHQGRYSRQQAIKILCTNLDGIFGSFFNDNEQAISS
ncbi:MULTISPECIES: TetR/AcrR family transcriptional regulator [unclassified Psychrobacter]|uniref:TetR/AcrR family transcriptional regulator n=1 Tax=unclassified Psychrobacter TaxID=196806 RepID=UPI0025E745BA|nr:MULTISPECIES: TetR/AcrR family transcriptional regulator [unclassified Psychrobacter]